MNSKLTTYDPADDLLSEEGIEVFMNEAFDTEDVAYIAHALGVVARSKGMAKSSQDAGLSGENLYRSFSEDGDPTLKSVLAMTKALGIRLTVKFPPAA